MQHKCIRERNKNIARRRAKHMAEYTSLVRSRIAYATAAAVRLEAGGESRILTETQTHQNVPRHVRTKHHN